MRNARLSLHYALISPADATSPVSGIRFINVREDMRAKDIYRVHLLSDCAKADSTMGQKNVPGDPLRP